MEVTCTEISVIRALVALCFIFSPRAFVSAIVSTGFHFMAAEEGFQNNFTAVKFSPPWNMLMGGGAKKSLHAQIRCVTKKTSQSKNTLNTNLRVGGGSWRFRSNM